MPQISGGLDTLTHTSEAIYFTLACEPGGWVELFLCVMKVGEIMN